MEHKVIDIANKIIVETNTEQGDTISNLKLQKLLYYLQGYWLAVFNKPLFNDEIEAWMYGPVVPIVYDCFKSYGASAIMPDVIKEQPQIDFSAEESDLFFNVLEEYGQFSAVKLMNMTHNETPWKSVEIGKGNVIAKSTMKNFFLTQIEND